MSRERSNFQLKVAISYKNKNSCMDQFQLHFMPLILITRIKETPDALVPHRFISLGIKVIPIKTKYAIESLIKQRTTN